MRKSRLRRARDRLALQGLTLLEVLISAVLLVLVAVPLGSLLWTSRRGIELADRGREVRFVIDQVITRVESTDFVALWKSFGWGFLSECPTCPESPEAIRDGLAVVRWSPSGEPEVARNPLELDVDVLKSLRRNGWTARLRFRFLTRPEVRQTGRVKSDTGILHLQGGAMGLTLDGPGVKEDVRQVLYCPMILGRPGLQLKQCPAVNPALREGLFASYP